VLALSLGDPSGIGPEVAARAWERRAREGVPPFVAVGSSASLAAISDVPVTVVNTPEQALACFDDALPLIIVDGDAACVPGSPDLDGARVALASLELAVGLAIGGAVEGVVTGPVSKAQLHAVGFRHPGQTEYVAERCGIAPTGAAMMLAAPVLRVVPITTHIALNEVAATLTSSLIMSRVRTTVRGLLKYWGIAEPYLALAALNPHAGEGGAMGREEIDIFEPALDALRAEGVSIDGPVPADAVFTPRRRALYDAILCPTHDQALIPFKALHVDEGVNITLGLSIVRTSADHGTAFDIAGLDQADAGATVAALRLAASAAACRRRFAS